MEQAEPEPTSKGFHWLIAAPLSLWCLLWLLLNGYSYFGLTWNLFRSLKWWSFALVFSPCFWIWLGFFSSAVWAPLNFCTLPWAKYDRGFSRGKILLLVLILPFAL